MKRYENNEFPGDKEYYEVVGYKESMVDSLSGMYQLWCDAEGLP